MNTAISENLLEAKQRLDNAISSLIDKRPHLLDNGTTTWLDSRYRELREAITGHHIGQTGRNSEPQPPVWIDGIDLISDIDKTVGKWEASRPEDSTYPTVFRLEVIGQRTFRPQDAAEINAMSADVERWVHRYQVLCDPKPKHMSAACPACGKTHVYRDSAGEQVRQPALQITVNGCVCQACRTVWEPAQFVFLATRLLGYVLPEGVLE